MSRRKRVHEGTEVDTPKTSTTPIFKVQRGLAVDYSKRKSISNQDIPLSSIYYRLFETLENHKVPCYTVSSYQQISMLSPQTPRNKRRCLLGKCFSAQESLHKIVIYLLICGMCSTCKSLPGLDLMKDQVQDTPMRSSCLTSLPSKIYIQSILISFS